MQKKLQALTFLFILLSSLFVFAKVEAVDVTKHYCFYFTGDFTEREMCAGR